MVLGSAFFEFQTHKKGSELSVNIDPNTQDLNPLIVIDSLKGQLAAAAVEIAKRDALVVKLAQQLDQQVQVIHTLSEAIENQNAAKTNGDVSADDHSEVVSGA